MSICIVVGVQWGDEGKGKVVDFLTQEVELVVRFQGGNNAGHTLVVEGIKFALRLLPSGIIRPEPRCLLASGVVVDPEILIQEFSMIEDAGIKLTPKRFGIAPEVHIILPYHKVLDNLREKQRGENKIGTTKKGIGPAYEDVASRVGLRIGDLFNDNILKEKVKNLIEIKNQLLIALSIDFEKIDPEKTIKDLMVFRDSIEPYVTDVGEEVAKAWASGRKVLFEGAQGSMLDVNHGTYPFVTSSNTVASSACVSAGIGPQLIDSIIGVCKAYCTRVGGGPFPTEEIGEIGDLLREKGQEFGTVTGRPRRCGWFDAVAVKRAIRLNGITSLFITKLDVLDFFEEIKIGTAYCHAGKSWPFTSLDLAKVKVEYKTIPGWNVDTTGITSFSDLPDPAKFMINTLEGILECPICGFSVGPDRKQTVLINRELQT